MDRITKVIKLKRQYKGQDFKSPPLFIPEGMSIPETAKSKMAKMMLDSGLISKDDYENMLGVTYDYNSDDINDSDFDRLDEEEEFRLSSLSSYDDEDTDEQEDKLTENFAASAKEAKPLSEAGTASTPPKVEAVEGKSVDEQASE